MGAEVNDRVKQVKDLGELRNVWKERSLSFRVKMSVFDGIVAPLVPYSCQAWALDKNMDRMNVLELKCLRMINGVRRVGHIRNDRVRERCSIKRTEDVVL